MSNNIPVLLTMDNASLRLFEALNPVEGRKLDRAREAVAELIEASERLIDSCNPEVSGWAEVVNALARVRGNT